jgi:hypothetical protein
MLTVNQLRDYTAQIKEAIAGIKRAEIAVHQDDLAKFMNDHTEGENILMISLLPGHGMDGKQDSAQYVNVCGFMFLEKNDLSELDNDGYLDIFSRTQAVVKEFMDKLIIDKSNNEGLFCGFLAWLEEASFSADPIKGLSGCNGWLVQINIKSNP